MNDKTILEEFLEAAFTTKQKQVKDLQMKESISLASITWSKFAEDGEGNAYMLADEKICDMEFGDDNDWRESPIRKKLYVELYQKITDELGADAVVTIQTDLFSHDGLKDYKKCEDMVSLLTYDLYRNNRENIKGLDEGFWMCTPDSTPSGFGSKFAQRVGTDGSVDFGLCDCSRAVRPFIILKSSIYVSCEES